MKEILLNNYFRIEPLEHEQFVVAEKGTYEEIGKVVARPSGFFRALWHRLCGEYVPVGAICFFDSYIAKRYPVQGEHGKVQWMVPFTELVKAEVYKDNAA